MAAPLMAELNPPESGVHVTVLAPKSVTGVLHFLPAVNEVIDVPWPHGGAQVLSRLAVARRLAKQRFDAAFVLPNSFKSALVPWFAGIPERIGYLGEARRGLLTQWLPNDDGKKPMREHYLALAPLLSAGVGKTPNTPLPPRLSVPADTIAAARKKFGVDPTRPLAIFCPGAEYGPAKRWPAEHFAKLAYALRDRDPTLQIALVGGLNDVATGDTIARLAPGIFIVTIGKTSIEDAVALLAGADVVVSNDSGLMHVAAALDRSQVALFGSTDPSHTPPQSQKARVLWLHLPCSPCFARVCPLGHLRCLTELTPDSVLAAIDQRPVH